MKKFNDIWTEDDIAEYIANYNILVLFSKSLENKYIMSIYGNNISEIQKEQLKSRFYSMFGSHSATDKILDKINEIAIKWHNKVIL